MQQLLKNCLIPSFLSLNHEGSKSQNRNGLQKIEHRSPRPNIECLEGREAELSSGALKRSCSNCGVVLILVRAEVRS